MAGKLDIRSKRAPFAMAFGPQVVSPRVSDGAKVTWLLLDVLAGRNGCLWYTVDRLAVLRGLKERALQSHLAELREAGWVTIEYRPRRTNLVTIVPPEELFGNEALQSFYETAQTEMGAEKCTPRVHENAPSGCGKMHPEGDKGKEMKEGEESPPLSGTAGTSAEDALEAAIRRALELEVPNREVTLRRWIRGWLEAYGAPRVLEVFRDDKARRMPVIAIEDTFFRKNGRSKAPPPRDPEQARRDREESERLSREGEERRKRREEIMAKLSECSPEELSRWKAEGELEADESGVRFGRELRVDGYIMLQAARKFGIASSPSDF